MLSICFANFCELPSILALYTRNETISPTLVFLFSALLIQATNYKYSLSHIQVKDMQTTTSTGLDIQTVLAGGRDIALELSNAAVQAFESRCALTKGECEGLHYSACRSRLPRGECTTSAMTNSECLGAQCGSIQDFTNPVGE